MSQGRLRILLAGESWMTHGIHIKGRTAAFASDCSPHWAPTGFTTWEYYPRFWDQLVRWLAGK